MPAVSICIPAFGEAFELEQSLDSILIQRYLDYEIIVSDSSADESIEQLVSTYDFGGRMRYFRNAHALAPSASRDEALRLSQSPLIKLLEPGHRFADAGSLGQFVAAMEAMPEALLGCCGHQDETGRVHPAPDADAQAQIRRLPESLLIEDVIGPLAATIHRRAAPLEFDPRLSALAPRDFYIRALRTSPRLAVVPEVLIVSHAEHDEADSLRLINEVLLVFGKGLDLLQHEPAFETYFWRVLSDLGIRNLKQLSRVAPLSPSLTVYFQHLFAHPPRVAGRGFLGRLRGVLSPKG